MPALPNLTLADGEDYWFDLSVRNPQLADRLSNATITLRWTEDDEESPEQQRLVQPHPPDRREVP